jgi:hypothetical protein
LAGVGSSSLPDEDEKLEECEDELEYELSELSESGSKSHASASKFAIKLTRNACWSASAAHSHLVWVDMCVQWIYQSHSLMMSMHCTCDLILNSTTFMTLAMNEIKNEINLKINRN